MLSSHCFPQVMMEYLYESYHGSTFVCSWSCSNLRLYDIDLHCMSGIYVQVWVLYQMDLRCILVVMVVYSSHGSALYWSTAMMRSRLDMSWKHLCITESWLMMIYDQAISFLEVINFSFKSLSYCIPLASCFGGHFVTHNSHHHHVSRPKTS